MMVLFLHSAVLGPKIDVTDTVDTLDRDWVEEQATGSESDRVVGEWRCPDSPDFLSVSAEEVTLHRYLCAHTAAPARQQRWQQRQRRLCLFSTAVLIFVVFFPLGF